MNYRTLIAGALGGLLSAVLVDLQAWKAAANDATFDWRKALTRWLTGLISGALAGTGAEVA